MNPSHEPRPKSRLLLLFAVVAMAVALLIGPAAGPAGAQEDPCAISNFIVNGDIDLVAYGQCVEAQNVANNELARTGSDTGLYIGFGAGLVALGAAFVYTSRRQRATV
ncbi:MAG: hypothetical protein QOD92_3148 [Acidimicrobiaceae bacterium]|jgi:LPXTG-motif cell wall-anchored protein